MAVELAPAVEDALRDRARQEGSGVSDMVARLLLTPSPAPKLELTPENDSLLAYLKERLDAAANATPEEIEEANREWEDFERALHENSFALGDYPESETKR